MRYWAQLTAGRGPAECARFVQLLMPRFTQEAEHSGCTTELLEAVPGPFPGTLASALLALDGAPAEQLLPSSEPTKATLAPGRVNHDRAYMP